MAYNFMADTYGHRGFTPTSINGVHIRPTNSTTLDFDINVILTKPFGFELVNISKYRSTMLLGFGIHPYLLLFELGPFLLILDHEALEAVWVSHFVFVYGILVLVFRRVLWRSKACVLNMVGGRVYLLLLDHL